MSNATNNARTQRTQRNADSKPDSKPEVAAEKPTWHANGLPDNDAAKAIVVEWQHQYSDACGKWSTWNATDKQSFATALASKLSSSFMGDMESKRNSSGYIRLQYNDSVRRYVRSITCVDATIGLDVRQWANDLCKAYAANDVKQVESLKTIGKHNPGYSVLDSHCKVRNKPVIVGWIGGGVRKSAGGSGEIRD